MAETIKPAVSPPYGGREPYSTEDDAPVNTDNLSPEAARRFERFAALVDRFEKAAASGALSPPVSASGSPR